jgi:hypothetical protein
VYNCYESDKDCLSKTEINGGICSRGAVSKAGRITEIDKKYSTLQTWLANRQSCATAVAACTGQKSCDWSTCKPGLLEFAFTNELQPRFPNTAVKWVFWGGSKQRNNAAYAQNFGCSEVGMVPVLITVEASWGLFTSYGFNASADVPLVENAGRDYYTLNPTALKAILATRLPAGTETVTFRAEYKCLCPPGYQTEMDSFDNLATCTPCVNGYYREAGMPACAPCPYGTYENGAHTQCIACPAGTFNNEMAAYYNATANILGCQPCPVLQVSTDRSSYCYPCDKLDPSTGNYFPTGGGPNTYASNSTTCTSCADNLYTNETANSTSFSCVRCPVGYNRLQNMTDCARAPPGMHMNDQFDSYKCILILQTALSVGVLRFTWSETCGDICSSSSRTTPTLPALFLFPPICSCAPRARMPLVMHQRRVCSAPRGPTSQRRVRRAALPAPWALRRGSMG